MRAWLRRGGGGTVQRQPQAPPQQPPVGAGAAEPVSATVVSSLTVSVWPSGQVAGAADSLIGLLNENVLEQSRQR